MSNLDGVVLAPGTVPDPGHFVRQTRETARFDRVLATLDGLGHGLFLEVGPHHTLSGLGRRELAQAVFVPSGRRGRGPERQLLTALGTLWTHGVPVDWARPPPPASGPTGPLGAYRCRADRSTAPTTGSHRPRTTPGPYRHRQPTPGPSRRPWPEPPGPRRPARSRSRTRTRT